MPCRSAKIRSGSVLALPTPQVTPMPRMSEFSLGASRRNNTVLVGTFRMYCGGTRSLRDAPASEQKPPLTVAGQRGEQSRVIAGGPHGRLAAELTLSLARLDTAAVGPSTLNDLDGYSATHGLVLLRARILGVLSLRPVPQQAQRLSKAIQEYDRASRETARSLAGVAEELQLLLNTSALNWRSPGPCPRPA